MVIQVKRAPVLTLWAAVVAERLGFDSDQAVTMGRVVAGLNAFAKGKRFGIHAPHPKDVKAAMERLVVSLSPNNLATRLHGLYEQFRPAVPAGVRGRGATGVLDLDRLRSPAPGG